MYAAREIGALARYGDLAVTVVGTRPPFPVEAIDRACPFPIHWYDSSARAPAWGDLTSRRPDVVFTSGWAFPLCTALASEARLQGSRVVCMVDNRLRRTPRQCLGAVRFRLGLRRRFDRFFVPGRQARDLMRFFGVPDTHVREGLYGADPACFAAATPASRRARTILFVGQMIERKGVDLLIEGFRRSGLGSQGWRLRCIGDGPLAARAAATLGCEHVPFLGADAVARELAAARLFILPSRNDNWGVALHEAALAGCLLAASRAVGAVAELMPGMSPLTFAAGRAEAIRDALVHASGLSSEAIDAHATAARVRAGGYGPDRFAREVAGFVKELTGSTLVDDGVPPARRIGGATADGAGPAV